MADQTELQKLEAEIRELEDRLAIMKMQYNDLVATQDQRECQAEYFQCTLDGQTFGESIGQFVDKVIKAPANSALGRLRKEFEAADRLRKQQSVGDEQKEGMVGSRRFVLGDEGR